MNDENIQRQMNFFLQQQAKFDENMIINALILMAERYFSGRNAT